MTLRNEKQTSCAGYTNDMPCPVKPLLRRKLYCIHIVPGIMVHLRDLCAGAGMIHLTHYSFLCGIPFDCKMCSSFTGETLQLWDGRLKKVHFTAVLYAEKWQLCDFSFFVRAIKLPMIKGPLSDPDLLQDVIYCRQTAGWRSFVADHIASINSLLCYPVESIQTFPLTTWLSIPISINADLWTRKGNVFHCHGRIISGRDLIMKGKCHSVVFLSKKYWV